MSEHRDDTRFKWIIGAIVIVLAMILILGAIKDMTG